MVPRGRAYDKSASGYGFKPLPEKPLCRIQKFRAQRSVGDSVTTGSGVDHNIEVPRNFPERPSKDLSKHALDAISNDCTSDFPRYRNSQSRMPNFIFSTKQHEMFRIDLPAGIIYRSVIRGSYYADRTWKLFRVRFIHSPSAFFVLWHAFA